jgi:hypothetical protein
MQVLSAGDHIHDGYGIIGMKFRQIAALDKISANLFPQRIVGSCRIPQNSVNGRKRNSALSGYLVHR